MKDRPHTTHAATVCLVAFLLLAALIAAETPDLVVQQALRSAAVQDSPFLREIALWFNWWGGDGVIYATLLLLVAGRVSAQRRLALIGLRGAEGIALSSALSGIVKGFAGRARPFVAPAEPWHFSFVHGWTDAHYFSMPSGHTTATFGFAAAVTFAALGTLPRGVRVASAVLCFASALLVAFARTWSDQHWFTDVLAGALIGTATGYWLGRIHAERPGSRFDRVFLGASSTS